MNTPVKLQVGVRAAVAAWLVAGACLSGNATAQGHPHGSADQQASGLSLSWGQSSAHAACGHNPKTLYVWAGDDDRTSPDFVAVVNFDSSSWEYGKITRIVPVPTANNEAHHLGLSADCNTLGAGGLLSVLQGQDDLFFFDVRDARNPTFIKSTSAPLSAITDDFTPLPGGGFLITNMGSKTGGTPGRVVEVDGNLNVVGEWPTNPPEGFNPHGISVRHDLNLMVTSDFVDPASTLNVTPGEPLFRNTIHVWDLAARSIVRTIPVEGAIGTMDVKLIPGDAQRRAFTAGMLDGKLYLVDTQNGSARPVYDLARISWWRSRNLSPQFLQITSDGTRLILPLGGPGLIVMFDISNPNYPAPLSVVDLGANSGPHMMHLTHDDQRLVVTNYFLNQDGFGKVKLDGDRKVHVLNIWRFGMWRDFRFNLDFNYGFPTGRARPHGVAMK